MQATEAKKDSRGGPHVVIVGAGFGGLQAAKKLCNKQVDLTIIDRRNHHLFQPLLYQVAIAELSPSHIAVPIRPLFRNHANVRVILRAEQCEDTDKKKEFLTFAIIGGGPTGVEMAGAIAEMARITMVKDFRNFEPGKARVILAEGSDSILGGMHPDLSAYARHALEKRGVEVSTNTFAKAIDDRGVRLGEETIRARTIIWSAGVRASPLAQTLGLELDRMGFASRGK